MHSYNTNINNKQELFDDYNIKGTSDRVINKYKNNQDNFNTERSEKIKNSNQIDLPIFNLKSENSLSHIEQKKKI